MIRRHINKIGLVLILLMVTASGCVSNSEQSDLLGSREMLVERKARKCYRQAITYMGKGRYLLARQQFSEAAAMAMSQELHDDAVAGLGRVDKIIEQRR